MKESGRLAVQATVTARPERATLMGMRGWRIPATLVREQVLNNNLGRMFLSSEEIAESVGRWNMTPVTLGHPRSNGRPISARHERVIDQVGLGWVLNAHAEDGELKADIFLPDTRLADLSLEDSIVGHVQGGQPIEVSTSFEGDFFDETGSHNGQSYDVVARDIEPDHFAILLDEEGACSVADGCGLGVNEEDDVDEASVDNVADSLWERFKAHLKRSDTMKDERIQALHEATGLSEERLVDMEEDEVEALAANVLEDEGEPTEPEETADNEAEEADEPPAWAENLMSRIEKLEEETEPVRSEQEERKADLRAAIADNSSFTEEELEGKDLAELEKIHGLTRPVSFAGRGGPKRDRASNEEPAFMDPVPHYADNDETED